MVKLNQCVVKSLANKKGYRCGKWNTDYKNGSVIVKHYGTDMLKIDSSSLHTKRAVGFESMSDKQGINKVLKELGITNTENVKADRGYTFD